MSALPTTCPSCGAFVRFDWTQNCGACGNALVAISAQPQSNPFVAPSHQWSPGGTSSSPRSGPPIALIVGGAVAGLVGFGFVAIIAIGAIGFLGGSAKNASASSAEAPAPDPGFAAALSEVTTSTTAAPVVTTTTAAPTTTTVAPKSNGSAKSVAPISGWVSFTDPDGNFRANMAGNPIESDEGGLAVWTTPYNDGYLTEVSYEALNGASSKAAIAGAVAAVGATYDITSTKSGTAYGNTYTEITLKEDVSGGTVYERMRFLAAGDTLYAVGVAGSSAASLNSPFTTLMAGFVPLDGSGSSSGVTA